MTPLPILLIHSAAAWAPDAPRYWPKYGGSRQVRLLDGAWRYGFIDGWDSGFDSMNASFRPSDGATPNMTSVPSCMDVVAGGAGGYLGPRGVGLFRTSFRSPAAGSAVRLQFQSCSFYCRVWVNGREVGDHLAGGYVAFALDVPADALSPDGGGENELFVLAGALASPLPFSRPTPLPPLAGASRWPCRRAPPHTPPARRRAPSAPAPGGAS